MTKAKKGFRARVYRLSVREVRSESGYTHVHVRWSSGTVHALADRLEGAIGNKAGYGTVDAAARVERETRELMDAGYTHHFHSDYSYGYSLHARFQLYSEATAEQPRAWCQPRFELDGTVSETLRQAEIVKALKLRGDFSPEQLVARLRKLARTIECADVADCWADVIKTECKVADLECNDHGELKSAAAARAARDAREAV